jgi:hypothetical protein
VQHVRILFDPFEAQFEREARPARHRQPVKLPVPVNRAARVDAHMLAA